MVLPKVIGVQRCSLVSLGSVRSNKPTCRILKYDLITHRMKTLMRRRKVKWKKLNCLKPLHGKTFAQPNPYTARTVTKKFI